jgi:lambda family phage minor tail protein L
MTSPITDVMTARSRQLNEQYPWVWLYEVEVPTTPPTRYRLTNYDQTITFGAASDGTPLDYTPFPVVQSNVEQNASGDLPQIQLQLSNESLLVKSILENYDGLVGQPIVIKLVHSLELGNPASALRFDGQIVSCTATFDRVSWNISALSLTQAALPGQRYIRNHCRFRYGDERCGYDLNNGTLATAHPSCPKTLDACELRGDAEEAAGLERQHPARFGGWPGIPRQGRR